MYIHRRAEPKTVWKTVRDVGRKEVAAQLFQKWSFVHTNDNALGRRRGRYRRRAHNGRLRFSLI